MLRRLRLSAGTRVLSDSLSCGMSVTCAGNPTTLTDLAREARHLFVQDDVGDGALVARLLTQHQITAAVHFAAESHVDRSIGKRRSLPDDECAGYS